MYWGTQGTCVSEIQDLEVRWSNNVLCEVHYFKFLDFFPVWGKYFVKHGRLYTGDDVFQACVFILLLH